MILTATRKINFNACRLKTDMLQQSDALVVELTSLIICNLLARIMSLNFKPARSVGVLNKKSLRYSALVAPVDIYAWFSQVSQVLYPKKNFLPLSFHYSPYIVLRQLNAAH